MQCDGDVSADRDCCTRPLPCVAEPDILHKESTLVFHALHCAHRLVHMVYAALTECGADGYVNRYSNSVGACIWDAAPGTGVVECAHVAVQCCASTVDEGTHYAVFARTHGDGFVFWRMMRGVLRAFIRDGGSAYTVASLMEWGTTRTSYSVDERASKAPPWGEEDLSRTLRMLQSGYEDICMEGCKMTVVAAVAAQESETDVRKFIATGLLNTLCDVALGDVPHCIESRTAAATACMELVTYECGRHAVADNDVVSAQLRNVVRSLTAAEPSYNERQLQRVAQRCADLFDHAHADSFKATCERVRIATHAWHTT